MIRNTILVCVILFFSGCEVDVVVPKKPQPISGINKVVILGNSISVHAPIPGWPGNWGMAASSKQNDFVHLLEGKLKEHNPNIELEIVHLADFETNFLEFDYGRFFYRIGAPPDLVIVRLGENVPNELAEEEEFAIYLDLLVSFFATRGHTNVICTESFWPKIKVNDQIRTFCERNGIPLVGLADLYLNQSNLAVDEYGWTAIGVHPSDEGMKNIADRIYHAIAANESFIAQP